VAAIATIGALRLLLLFRNRLPQDLPNERSLHAGAIPRVGGLAIWAGGGTAVALGASMRGIDAQLLGVLLAAAALALLSFFDDRRSLPAGLRMIAHLAAAAWVVGSMAPLPVTVMAPAVLGVAWMTNLYNFMDGSDGLAGGMALIGFSAYGLAALGGSADLALLDFMVAAAAAGFLVFNFHPARVFMGDAGSIPLGFLAGGLGLVGWQLGAWPAWFPVLVFSPFIVDASITLLRRALRGERVWQAHREHYYQRLVQMGWGHRRTALAEYAVMLAAGGSALFLLRTPEHTQWVGLAAWAAIYAALAWRVDRAWAAAS
jgi:UDP-N-acetylmuramyl pentapeptide phosphotransferase/UDP-N-acetylglucosamine-1-phosphate transferase